MQNTDVLSPAVMCAIGILIHEATHDWQHTFSLYRNEQDQRS